MEEITKIITAITEVTGLDRFSIAYGRNNECKRARGILCYIALKDKYGLTNALSERLNKSRSQCTFLADFCKEEMEESVGYIILMNEVRKKLGMSPMMKDVMNSLREEKERQTKKESEQRSKEISQRIFGIEYFKSEEAQLNQAMLDAKAFIDRYSKIGIQMEGKLTRCPY